MRPCVGMEARLNDSLDGLLSGPDRAELDRHLEGCPRCREFLAGLGALARESAALPRSLEPPTDLWPGIEASLGERGADLHVEAPVRGAGAWRWGLAAAAVLAAVTAAILFLRPETPGVGPPVVTVSRWAVESAYRRDTDELMAVLQGRRDELSPETLAVVEENLRIINQAIQEVWDALENDPGRPGNGHLVTHLYRKKVALLQQAVRLPAEG